VKGFKVSNETKVGALAAIAITMLVLGYNFLKGKDLFTRTSNYYVIYDRSGGVVSSNPVTINDYKVGQVTKVSLLPEDSMKVRVDIEVISDVKVTRGSIAKIYSSDFFGSKAVELLISSETAEHEEGSRLKGEMEPSLVNTLSTIASPLKLKVESILTSLDSVFGGESDQKLKMTIDNIEYITANFKSTSDNLDKLVAEQSKKLDDIFDNVYSISENLKKNNENITAAIANFKKVSDTLAASNIAGVVRKAEATLAQVAAITEKINKGEGSLGMLVNNDELYNNLKNSSASLDALLKDLKESPKRYVHFSIFGKKGK